jgi:hypothetical protein
MCECGCDLMGQRWELQGNNGTLYVVHKYPGCKNCSAPCGISIQKIYQKERNLQQRYPELKFTGNKYFRSTEIPFFSQEELQKQLKEYLTSYLLNNNFFEKPFDKFDADTASEEFAQQFMDNMNDVKYELK